jgi:hypothetical protein
MINKQNDHFNETVKEAKGEMSTIGIKKSPLHANEIVSDLKNITRQIDIYSMVDEIDFLGCSSIYVIEKICRLEVALKYLKKNIRLLDK